MLIPAAVIFFVCFFSPVRPCPSSLIHFSILRSPRALPPRTVCCVFVFLSVWNTLNITFKAVSENIFMMRWNCCKERLQPCDPACSLFRTKGAPPVSSANQCLITKSAGQVSYKLSADRVLDGGRLRGDHFKKKLLRNWQLFFFSFAFIYLPSLPLALSLSLSHKLSRTEWTLMLIYILRGFKLQPAIKYDRHQAEIHPKAVNSKSLLMLKRRPVQN